FVFRENRVPRYQRLFARHDKLRIWQKSPRAPFVLYPYYLLTAVSLGGSMYMMGRMVMGHKTWFGKD
ncbi:hypothetical protein P152DRAFT_388783, partial [Eremomyces bilateralis CBS 781.70]